MRRELGLRCVKRLPATLQEARGEEEAPSIPPERKSKQLDVECCRAAGEMGCRLLGQ